MINTKFPQGVSGISWNEVPGVRARYSQNPKPNYEEYLPIIRDFFDEFIVASNIAPQHQVILVGDGAMDIAIKTTSANLRECLRDVLSFPQHLYIVSEDFSWCFNYTFEDNIYFGHSVR